MRFIRAILIINLIFISFFSNVYSQAYNLEKKITIVMKNKTLGEVLTVLQQKTDISFSFNSQIIDVDRKVSVVARKKSLDHIFKNLFKKINIEYTPVEKQIVLKKKYITKQTDPVIKKEKAQYTISGYIKNEDDNEVLIGAGITVQNSYLGAMTNSYGYYSLNLPEGKYILNFSYLGFEEKTVEVNLNSDKYISQQLKTDETELEIVVVNEEESLNNLEKSPLKKTKLTEYMINSNVGLVGEADVIKSIQTIPGINAYGDGSVHFFVRGGDKDQNLIMIDEVPIYNPSHLFGFFSAVSPEAINDIKIYKNNFPLKYGGRISSLIDIKTKEGNLNKFGFSGKISPFTGSYTLDGPIRKERSSFLISLRNSHINWLLRNNDNESSVKFSDFHIKFNQKINRNNRLFFSFYTGNDILEINSGEFSSRALSWQNNAISLRWNHLYSDKLFSNITLHTGKYDYFLYYNYEDEDYWNTFIGNLSLKNDFSFYKNPDNIMNFGFNINSYFFNPGNLNNQFFERTVYSSDALEYVLYFGNELNPVPKLNILYGLRTISFNNVGPTVVFSYDENFNVSDTTEFENKSFNTFLNLEPQLSISYIPSKKWVCKLSYDRHIQYLQLLSNSISPFTTLDVWMPAGLNIKPEKSHQFVLGITKFFTETEFSAEAYYKKTVNSVELNDHSNTLLNPYIEGELRFGESYSYGIELSMKKQKGNFTFYSSYSYSRVFIQSEDLNNGEKYPARYDKPHNASINLSYHTAKRWSFNLNWIYSSGMRFSSPTAYYYYRGYQVPVYTKKNNDKLPDYHRLDISVKVNLNKSKLKKYKHDLTFSIFNLYRRENLVAINFNKIQNNNNDIYVPSNLISEYEMITTKRSLLGMIPSLTYSFNFR